jgi:hypothetical protein
MTERTLMPARCKGPCELQYGRYLLGRSSLEVCCTGGGVP